MKANELRKKYRIFITGTAMAVLLAGTAACSSQTASAGTSSGGGELSTAVSTESAADQESGADTDSVTASDPSGQEAEPETIEQETESENVGQETGSGSADQETESDTAGQKTGSDTAAITPGPARKDIAATKTLEGSEAGAHVITADGEEASYTDTSIVKTGDSDLGDEADFYGDNAAVFATNGASLTLKDLVVDTNGTHANGVFSYGEGTTVDISDSYITTGGNCSGGLMTTGGGTMNAQNLTIETSGNSSAAIRSDRGGGTVTVDGGTYTTSGVGSPVVYSTADITVSNAEMESTASQGVVVEGKNSVTLNNVELTADNNQKNGRHSDYYQAVMLYQSMSGDAAEGTSSFAMNGGKLVNQNGDIFFVTNTSTTIDLHSAEIINQDGAGIFLRAAAAGWGNTGSNGGHVNLTAQDQEISGDLVVDEVSGMNLYLREGSMLTGAINPEGAAGSVYVEIEDGSKWVLTGDSYVTGLTCGTDAVDLNGFTLHVGDTTYEAGTASTGEAIAFTASSGESASPAGTPGKKNGTGDDNMTPPDGSKRGPGGSGMTPPDGSKSGTGTGGTTGPDGSKRGPGGSGMTPPDGGRKGSDGSGSSDSTSSGSNDSDSSGSGGMTPSARSGENENTTASDPE